MNQSTEVSRDAIAAIAERHGFSAEAASSMLDALVRGGGGMAQFSHSEFGGSGQWMVGGMTMVSDMFNHRLAARVDALCSDLASLVRTDDSFSGSTNPKSQHQRSGPAQSSAGSVHGTAHVVSEAASDSGDAASVASAEHMDPQQHWWPSGLGSPNSTGDQNGVRYAYFAGARRLAIQTEGRVTLYDTLNHQISGFAQQQPDRGSPTFFDGERSRRREIVAGDLGALMFAR